MTALAWPERRPRPRRRRQRVRHTGTNAHVVLEEAPASCARRAATVDAPARLLLPLVREESQALARAGRAATRDCSRRTGAGTLADRAVHGHASRRSHHAHRLAVAGRRGTSWRDALRALRGGERRRGHRRPRGRAGRAASRVRLPGQGSQWLGMGARLLATRAGVPRWRCEQCDRRSRPYVDWSLLDELEPSRRPTSRLDEIDVIQPVLFAIEVALAALLARGASSRTRWSATAWARSPRRTSPGRCRSTTRRASSAVRSRAAAAR